MTDLEIVRVNTGVQSSNRSHGGIEALCEQEVGIASLDRVGEATRWTDLGRHRGRRHRRDADRLTREDQVGIGDLRISCQDSGLSDTEAAGNQEDRITGLNDIGEGSSATDCRRRRGRWHRRRYGCWGRTGDIDDLTRVDHIGVGNLVELHQRLDGGAKPAGNEEQRITRLHDIREGSRWLNRWFARLTDGDVEHLADVDHRVVHQMVDGHDVLHLAPKHVRDEIEAIPWLHDIRDEQLHDPLTNIMEWMLHLI